jgi:hypothetical protein
MPAAPKNDTPPETPATDAAPLADAVPAALAVGDLVTYSGPLGTYPGRVAEVDGPRHFVHLDGVGRVLCGAADLTADADTLLSAAGSATQS